MKFLFYVTLVTYRVGFPPPKAGENPLFTYNKKLIRLFAVDGLVYINKL